MNAVSALVEVPGAGSLAVTSDVLWVGSRDRGTITRVDPVRARVTRVFRVGGALTALAISGGKLWAAAQTPVGARRGGTLTVHAPGFGGTLDPASAYDSASRPLLALVGDGLVGYRRMAGAAGAGVVADLARDLPEVGDGGTTYRFRLRPGLRYSTGASVRARDVKASVERLHLMGAAAVRDLPCQEPSKIVG